MTIYYSVSVTLSEAQVERLNELAERLNLNDNDLILTSLEILDRQQLEGDKPSVFAQRGSGGENVREMFESVDAEDEDG